MPKRRYHDFNTYLRDHFGSRVQKITIDAGFSCPNRDGTISFGGCTYCDGKGSGSGAAQRAQSITRQVQEGKARLAARYKAEKFIAYFQAYTNTHAPCDVLRTRYDEAITDPEVVGLSIGTRPDCIDEARLGLIQEYTGSHMVWIEYGLQSMHNRTLESINRGHTFEDFVRAVRMSQGRDILICAHVILGLPGESKRDIVETARALADLGIDGIKIHSLYVLKETPLAGLFEAGGFTALDQETFVSWVLAFLENVPSTVVIQRLTGDPDPSALLGPVWTLKKQKTLALIQEKLEASDTWQGKSLDPGVSARIFNI
ncbi:MAG: TIGR01212 family radical SAM protein [Deltaproteobacteria bacterium]|nr:TIGR01212 family radical SAM protein [Deltaproteobacteria bacterium]